MTLGYKIEDDGSFFISYKDFCQYYTSIEVCRVFFKKKYLKQSYSGEFSKNLKTSGSYEFPLECPQYYLDTTKGKYKQFICVSLMQSDKRVMSNSKSDSICAGIRIFKAKGKKAISEYHTYTHSVPLFEWSREVILEFNVDPGQYIILPCVFQPGMESPFTIRVFSDAEISLEQILPNPKSQYQQELSRNLEWIDEFKTIQTKGYEQMKMMKEKETLKKVTKIIQNDIKKPTNIQLETSTVFGFSKPLELKLSNQNLTLLHGLNNSCAKTVFGNQEYKSGRHFCSFKIDSTSSPSNIMIGVSDPNVQTNLNMFLSHQMRGWV